MALFRIDWLGNNGEILKTNHLDKDDIISVGNTLAHRWLRSFHLIPDGCRGYYITPLDTTGTQVVAVEIQKPKEQWEIEYEKAKAEGFGSDEI